MLKHIRSFSKPVGAVGLMVLLVGPAPSFSSEEAVSLQTSAGFKENYRVSDADKRSYWAHTFSSGAHNLSVRGENVYAAWYDVRNGDSDIIFTRSTDGGKTFSPNIRVNDDRGKAKQYKPSLGLDASGVIYILWRDDRRGHADIFFSRSEDGGKTFSKNRRVNDDKGWAYQGNPSLAASPDGYVYASWSDNRNGQDDIYFAASRNGGKTFSRNLRLNQDEGRAVQSHPSVAAGPGGLVVVAWEDFRSGQSEIYMARSTDGGKTFEPNRSIRAGSSVSPVSSREPRVPGAVQISPSVTVGPQGWVAVAWSEFVRDPITLEPPDAATGETLWWEEVRRGDADIQVALSTDGGKRFGPPIRVNDDTVGSPQAFPSVALDANGKAYVAWEDFRDGEPNIYFTEFQGGTVNIGTNRKVNDDSGRSGQSHPSLAVDPTGRSYVLWTDGRGNPFVEHSEEDEEGNDVYFTSGE